MKVLGVNQIGLLFFIGWASIATLLLYHMAYTIVSTMEWSSPFSNGLSDCFNGVCIEDKSNNPSGPLPMSSEGIEGTSNDPILERKHKIFLSHSGAQKEFVEHLCKALEDRFYYPFFDRRHESLPKGERFSELIIQAAKQCEMLIVVVSKEYFMSKWPMIELSAFVKANKLHHESKSSTKGPKILPLFYGLSLNDLEDATMQKKWFRKWEILAKADPKKRIIVEDWKYALDILRSFNGILYDRELKEIVAYEEKIVSYICKSIAPDIRWDDFHVQGKSNILKVIGEKIEGIGISREYNVKVVGIYGVGGIGKTTTCKILCNELSSKYEGRVCHVEFSSDPSSDSKEFFQKVLQDLTRKNVDDIQRWNEGECKDVLRKSLWKQGTFLAIDNVSDNYKSIQVAKTLLELSYHPDSLVVVTARSPSVLESLGLDGDVCLEMPDLGEVDAMRLFLNYAASGKQFFEFQEKQNILTCIRRCYFSKGDGQGHHYHPLALQALGLQLGFHGKSPSAWVKILPQVETFNSLSGGNPVFDILRGGFDLLSPREQTFFMDLGYFSYMAPFSRSLHSEWVFDMYKQNAEESLQQVEHLKQKGLLVDVDLRSKRISMHDLYREFSHLEARGSLNKLLKLEERKWMFVDNGNFIELVRERGGGYWHNLIRLSIKYHCRAPWQNTGGIEGIEDIKWDYFLNLEVLQLCGLDWGHGAVKFEGLGRLKILEVINGYIDRIEGLEKLKHLTCFTWVVSPTKGKSQMQRSHPGMGANIVGQLPSSLKRLTIFGDVVLGSDLLARCHHLSNLELHWVVARSLDLSNCSSLEKVSLWGVDKLQTLSGLGVGRSSNLQSLNVLRCSDLVDIPGINHLISLKELLVKDCPKFEVPSLNGFNQLEVLSLRGIDGLTSLAELGDLSALRRLDLGNCKHLMRLPDLSKSRNLQKLNLQGCSTLELHKRDIQMLFELPLLEPLLFHDKDDGQQFRLDLRRGKLLVNRNPFGFSMEDEWEERNLGPPPIKIKKLLDPFFIGDGDVIIWYDSKIDVPIPYTNEGWRYGQDLDTWLFNLVRARFFRKFLE